ncbi:hypothetical protein MTO96_004641 [Rhipicephalus appendiculatus]
MTEAHYPGRSGPIPFQVASKSSLKEATARSPSVIGFIYPFHQKEYGENDAALKAHYPGRSGPMPFKVASKSALKKVPGAERDPRLPNQMRSPTPTQRLHGAASDDWGGSNSQQQRSAFLGERC